MKRPTVQKAIQEISQMITPEAIKVQLVNIVQSATKTSDRIRALELLGKMLGVFGAKDKAEIKTLELLFQQ